MGSTIGPIKGDTRSLDYSYLLFASLAQHSSAPENKLGFQEDDPNPNNKLGVPM